MTYELLEGMFQVALDGEPNPVIVDPDDLVMIVERYFN